MSATLQRGDTIIEVLLGITVFSLVAVGAMVIMNSGTNTTQRSLEVSLVRQQINAQAEALRAAYQQDIALHNSDGTSSPVWSFIKSRADMSPLDIGQTCPNNFGSGFILNAHTAEATKSSVRSMNEASAPPYAQVFYDTGDVLQDSYGIWIEKETTNDFTPQAYDFRVRACWYGPGQDAPMQLQTIVRLYEAY